MPLKGKMMQSLRGKKKKTKTKKTSDELRKGEGLDSLGKGSRETLKKI